MDTARRRLLSYAGAFANVTGVADGIVSGPHLIRM